MSNEEQVAFASGDEGLEQESRLQDAASKATYRTSTNEQIEFNSDATETALNEEHNEGTDEEGVDEGQGDSEDHVGEHSDDSGDSLGTSEDTLHEEVLKNEAATNEIKEALSSKGVDFDKVAEEYNTNNGLSKETMEALNKAGYPNTIIEAFIAGRQALENRYTEAVFKNAGGEQEYLKVINWAKHNVSQDTLNAYNKAIDSNDLSSVNLMFDGMKAKMSATLGTTNKSIHGSAGVAKSQPKGFTSKADIVKAMSDKRYGRDAGYTRSVELKMYNTQF